MGYVMSDTEIKRASKKVKVHEARMYFNCPVQMKDEAYEYAISEGMGFSEYLRNLIRKDLELRKAPAKELRVALASDKKVV